MTSSMVSGKVSSIVLMFAGVLGCCSAPAAPLDMIQIPAGEFQMGDHVGDGRDCERPVHPVYMDSFRMSRYEITNAQYCEFLNSADVEVDSYGIVYSSPDDARINRYLWTYDDELCPQSQISYDDGLFVVRGRDGSRPDHPVACMWWGGAVAYCNWLSGLEGYDYCYDPCTLEPLWPGSPRIGYRLPTEAEWEYAARGGCYYYKYPWCSDTVDCSHANYYDCNPFPSWFGPFTVSVGSYTPNGYGLYEMAGNVWEWCNDGYDTWYYETSCYRNPTGPRWPPPWNTCVRRGGSWADIAMKVTVYRRGSGSVDGCYTETGFRPVLDLNPTYHCWLNISWWSGGSVTTPAGQNPWLHEYDCGQIVQITATPDPGHQFVEWAGTAVTAGEVASPSSASTTVTVDADYNLVAIFSLAGPLSPPTVETLQADSVTATTATLRGRLEDDGGEACGCWFTWKKDGGLSWTSRMVPGQYSTGQQFSATLTNLDPGTTYVFRAHASNTAGERLGAERAFETAPGNTDKPAITLLEPSHNSQNVPIDAKIKVRLWDDKPVPVRERPESLEVTVRIDGREVQHLNSASKECTLESKNGEREWELTFDLLESDATGAPLDGTALSIDDAGFGWSSAVTLTARAEDVDANVTTRESTFTTEALEKNLAVPSVGGLYPAHSSIVDRSDETACGPVSVTYLLCYWDDHSGVKQGPFEDLVQDGDGVGDNVGNVSELNETVIAEMAYVPHTPVLGLDQLRQLMDGIKGVFQMRGHGVPGIGHNRLWPESGWQGAIEKEIRTGRPCICRWNDPPHGDVPHVATVYGYVKGSVTDWLLIADPCAEDSPYYVACDTWGQPQDLIWTRPGMLEPGTGGGHPRPAARSELDRAVSTRTTL